MAEERCDRCSITKRNFNKDDYESVELTNLRWSSRNNGRIQSSAIRIGQGRVLMETS